MLFPMSVVLMNLEGSFKYQANIRALQTPCLFRNSIRSLLEDMKAISMPEKNAEQSSVMKITRIDESIRIKKFEPTNIIRLRRLNILIVHFNRRYIDFLIVIDLYFPSNHLNINWSYRLKK